MQASELNRNITFTAPAYVWLAVHGNLCLSLRHPLNTGPSRRLAEEHIVGIEQALLTVGVLDAEDIKKIHRTEHQNRLRQDRWNRN